MLLDLHWDFIALQEAHHVTKSRACFVKFGTGNVCVTGVNATVGRPCPVLIVNSKLSKHIMDSGACDGCVAAVVKLEMKEFALQVCMLHIRG